MVAAEGKGRFLLAWWRLPCARAVLTLTFQPLSLVVGVFAARKMLSEQKPLLRNIPVVGGASRVAPLTTPTFGLSELQRSAMPPEKVFSSTEGF